MKRAGSNFAFTGTCAPSTVDVVNRTGLTGYGEFATAQGTIIETRMAQSGFQDKENNLINRLYPNPATDLIHFQAEKEEEFQFQILDLTGRVLHTSTWNGLGEWTYPVHSFSAGVYVLEYQSASGSGRMKFIKP